jgi:Ca-activated chloride channel homolog
MYLDQVTTDWIQLQGTALTEAITQSVKSFSAKKHKDNVLILLSDGEDHTGDPVAAATEAAAQGVKIYTIGLGSESGVPIPLQTGGGNVVYKKDNDGNLVLTKLNPVVLEHIAIATGGTYFHVGSDLDLQTVYQEIGKLEKTDLGASKVAVFEEQYQAFLLIALLFLLAEFFVPERVRVKEEWRGRFGGA